MRKLISFMHVSLDGFVTDAKGGMGWIHVDDEIFDYAADMTDQSDTGLYGRVTYQMMEAYWPTAADKPNASKHDKQHAKWYNAVPKVVLSKTLKGNNIPNTQIVSDNIAGQIQQLKKQSGKSIVIFGSPSATHTLMQLDLIDEFWLFVNPVLTGGGIPMFKNIEKKATLQLLETKQFTSGVVGLHYAIK